MSDPMEGKRCSMNCGCTTKCPPGHEFEIVFCPLHAAAGRMLSALKIAEPFVVMGAGGRSDGAARHRVVASAIAAAEEIVNDDKCRGCGGKLGWISPDNGQWVSCKNCESHD